MITKAQYAEDIFTTEMEARSRSRDMGLDGVIHVDDYDGQAVYMPAASHEAYIAFYEAQAGVTPEEPEDDSVSRTDALRAIVAEVLGKSMEFEDWGEPSAFTKAEYQGKEVPINKPRRLSGGNKKFEVFVQDGDKVKRVTFGDPNMEIRRDDDEARANFRARHNCDSKKDKTSAGYWSCRMWEKGTSVSEVTKVSTGDKVSWSSSGGTASGIVRQIVRDGTVPDIPVKVTGSKEEPAARIEITDDDGKPTGQMVGHKLSTLNKSNESFETELPGKILKLDEEQRIIFGWASVTKVDGVLVVDRQGDVIRTETLHKAINEFMKGVRVGKLMHQGERVGDIIHSFPVSKDIMGALGIQTNKEGWIVGYYVEDDNLWKRVKSGDYAEFSIGGSAHKEEFNGD